ncbi:hypothetical protein EUZ87_05170 [Lactiplantibacillus paraplantarum]|uniref:Uncharacterized protein n=1 Tax=Lactiplantibacillus paraplantarum TaxID=60520 RepID=A0A4Q9Y2D7_9LACO|nr:hypothetical protein EUZ87_05170 [Lactiplantibacillus paraplantarum]
MYNEADTLRMIIVRSHSGADLKDFNDAEKEVLFKRNVKFKIISQYLLNGKPIMEVEEVEQ